MTTENTIKGTYSATGLPEFEHLTAQKSGNASSKILKHKEICNDLYSLYIKKNADYGDSVSQTYKKYGMTSFLVRMEDKINRVCNIINKDIISINDESIKDTLYDLANYAILAIIELEGDENKE